MMKSFGMKGGLTVTTAIVACGLIVLTPQGRRFWANDPDSQIGEADVRLEEANPPLAPVEEAEALASTATTAEVDASADAASKVAPPLPEPVEAAPTIAAAPPPTAESAVLGDAARAQSVPADGAADMVVGLIALGGTGDQSPPAFAAPGSEAFANAVANPVKVTAEEPVSTFSIDVDTASWAIIRNSIMSGNLPPADAVRVEEMVNYFPYDYPTPEPGQAFRPYLSVGQTPWNPETQLVTIGIQGALPQMEDRPPLNLVFLIDTSGSMDEPAKLPLLKQSFRLMLSQLRPEDQVAIVEYAGSAGTALPPTSVGELARIEKALANLGAGGSTNGVGGLQEAYEVAAAMTEDGEVSRVILATDGDFNVGIADPAALADYIAQKRETGIYLSVLGFGRGNLDDATMQALAQNGNGQAAYIDTLGEAQKVLVDQLTGALYPIADDMKIQIEWNPAAVGEYRLIGYETRLLAREDFNNDAVDAGELGAGLQVTALYEVTSAGSPALLNDPLRYQTATAATDVLPAELGYLKLRWKEPGADNSTLLETPIPTGTEPSAESSFAAAIAGFGQLLRGGTYLGDWSYPEAIALASASKGNDEYGYRADAIRLMRLAQSLSGN